MGKESLTIKTITCHDVYNAGASLQAYALSNYLRSLGHQVEIIDYKPDYLKHYELWGVRNPRYNRPIFREIYNLLKLPKRIKNRFSKRKKAFDDFTKKYLCVTKNRYRTNQEMKNGRISADVFFAGSDQIWNTLFQNGKDPAFYLEFAPESAICASYAASFATDDVAEEWKEKVAAWIKKLDFVSVREKSGLGILNNLGREDACQVVDPVFLLSRDTWEALLDNKKENEDYLLIYDFDNNQELNEKAVDIAKKNGWKIYAIFPNSTSDKCFYNDGPLEFVKLVKNAKFVLSNSFHATAFSIIFERQFRVFERKEKINTRMRDLLSGLEITMDEEKIDYGKVNKLLNEQISCSKKYIETVLDVAGKE